jgi:hypothetical protein
MKIRKRVPSILRLYKNGKMVYGEHLCVNSSIVARAQREMWDNGYIKVLYGHGNYNHADFKTVDELKILLSVFTEKALLDEFGVKYE